MPGRDAMPQETPDPMVGEAKARGHGDEALQLLGARAIFIHGEIPAEPDAERVAAAGEAGLEPPFGHHAVAPDEARIALVHPADRSADHRPERVAVFDRAGAGALRLEAVNDGLPKGGEDLVVVATLPLRRRRPEAGVLVEAVADG